MSESTENKKQNILKWINKVIDGNFTGNIQLNWGGEISNANVKYTKKFSDKDVPSEWIKHLTDTDFSGSTRLNWLRGDIMSANIEYRKEFSDNNTIGDNNV